MDKRQKHRLFTAAGCSAALPFHSSDPDPDARTSRDDLRPSPVTTTRSLLPTGEDRQVMHLSTSYTPNFPRQTAVLSDIKAYGQTSSSCSCSATCASSVRASTNAGEQALYSISMLQGFLFMQLRAQMPLKLAHLKGIWAHPYATAW